MVTKSWMLLAILFFHQSVFATDYIVKVNDVNLALANESLSKLGLKHAEVLSKNLNIHLYSSSDKSIPSVEVLKSLLQNTNIKYAQEDHRVSLRTTPNDTEFEKQWSLENESVGIKAKKAWGIGTGGVDATGNEIVVAVIDDGVGRHRDLVDNLWVNKNEVPSNQIDDDNNGYVDDVYGWNTYNNNGTIVGRTHGTHVAGIIGAKGDNSQDISGINWNVKVMPISGSSGKTSVVIKSYDYVLTQKKLWLSTNGLKGANVVVTNSSFGVDYADCTTSDYPVWNDMYTALGEVGILSAVAAPNLAIDVDVKGDVPSACDSPYIVSVTNTTKEGVKYQQAGWGIKHVDIAAPGTAIPSTVGLSGIRNLTGTSMATPHVAGAIALAHSAASRDLNDLYYAKPGQAALVLKSILLSTVSPQADLQTVIVSGGRLNLFETMKAVKDWKQN